VIVLAVLAAGPPEMEAPALAVEVAAEVADVPTLVVLPSLLVIVVPDAAALGEDAGLDAGVWATVLMPPEHAASAMPPAQASAPSAATR